MNQTVKDTLSNLEKIAADSQLSKEFVDAMTLSEHRTHQQRIAKLLVSIFRAHAENGRRGLFDGRNEATIQFSQKLQDSGVLDDARFPLI